MLRRPTGNAWATQILRNRAVRVPPLTWARLSSTGAPQPKPSPTKTLRSSAEAARDSKWERTKRRLWEEVPKTRQEWRRLILLAVAIQIVWTVYDNVRESSPSPVPPLEAAASEELVPVESPVEVLDLEAANAKLRRESRSFVFEGQDKVQGRVDVVRVASNHPVEDEWDLAVAKGVGGSKTLYSGVYDGHAGWATSKVLKQSLVSYVSAALSRVASSTSGNLVDEAIKNAFVRLDDRITADATDAVKAGYDPGAAEVISAIAPAIAGSCALLSIYDPQTSTLRTAVTGDSRAVRGAWSDKSQQFEADQLSVDQTGFNKGEVDRIDREHPGEKDDILSPVSGRLLGLAVTRAFGDHRWKWTKELITTAKEDFYGTTPRPSYKTPPYMSAEPEVTTRQVRTDDFVILASDGLWDTISNEDAVACVSRWLAAKRAGRPEPVKETKHSGRLGDGWTATPEHFAIEDLDSAAVCLVKNALGGSRRQLFLGAVTTYAPMSRNVRDDMTVQVIFFRDPYQTNGWRRAFGVREHR
ncbi:phosphatase 2C-like domain-containing protein [Dactylonectria macrodidyma]|uniref:Phosphatase 2C-like domain-containing protein n=1 Tax=Dactylonectria macrodidyma TaxID=307937 RepID=A0A9P9DVX5_9HYPO|nr:phosphatase 2C-like domain-containing protein [Dactylonectria macrodidyma]